MEHQMDRLELRMEEWVGIGIEQWTDVRLTQQMDALQLRKEQKMHWNSA